MRPVYQALLDIYIEMEQVLSKEGKLDHVYYAKYEVNNVKVNFDSSISWLSIFSPYLIN